MIKDIIIHIEDAKGPVRGNMLKSIRWAVGELIRPLLAIWTVCGGRERRRKRVEARILAAIIDNMTRTGPMPHLQDKKKTPAE